MTDSATAVERGVEVTAALGLRDRCLITVTVLIALNREPMAMKPNIRRAIRQGISDREFREMLYQTMHYAGWAVGGPAMRNYQEVLREPEFEGQDLPAGGTSDVLLNDTDNAYQLGIGVLAENSAKRRAMGSTISTRNFPT